MRAFTLVLLTTIVSPALADPHAFVRALGRGVNLGNLLDAPSEGAWGVMLDPDDAANVARGGFASVRVPIRWDGTFRDPASGAVRPRVQRQEPWTVAPEFFERVDSVIAWSRRARLLIVINDHHHDSLFHGDYERGRRRFLAMWNQIATRYAHLPTDSVAFEILNEPNNNVTSARWNELLDTTLQIIRSRNPDRPVVIGTADWGGVGSLPLLRIPDDDNLILTIHYYLPFSFTHQGAEWVRGAHAWLGTDWEGNWYDRMAIDQDFGAVATWARARNLPVWLGEFGVYSKAALSARARWTAYVARRAESLGMTWAYWEYKSGHGVWNPISRAWNEPLRAALLSPDTSILVPTIRPRGTEILLGGDFASSLGGWELVLPNGRAQVRLESGAARVEVSDPGTTTWGVQFLKQPVRLEAGRRYGLSFRAWSDRAVAITSSVDETRNYMSYGATTVLLDSVPRSFALGFMTARTDSTARVCFNLGHDRAVVFLDDVRLVELDPPGAVRRGR